MGTVIFTGCQTTSSSGSHPPSEMTHTQPQDQASVESEVDSAIKDLDSSIQQVNPDELNGSDFTVE